MILKQCYIDNFGKFSNKTIDFEKQLTSFDEENGWGKTTLASFIKAMFYGMEEKRGTKTFFEREKYSPWQGGKFGGYLVFLQGKNEYKIIRYFGSKKKDDTFELIDMETNKLTNVYPENIGDKIFGVNLDTFERSVFVTLDDEKKPQTSVDITAKLNDLVSASNDVSNFDSAYELLDDSSKKLKAKKGDSGKIDELAKKISEDNNKLSDFDEKEKTVKSLQNTFNEKEKLISKKNDSVKNLQNEFSLSEKFQKKQNYILLKNKNLENEKQQQIILNFFNGKIPEDKTLESITIKNNECNKYDTLLKNNPATETDRSVFKEISSSFKGDVPTLEAISSCQKDSDDYSSLIQEMNKYKLSDNEEKEYSDLNKIFSGKNISSEKIKEYLQNNDKAQNLKNETLELTTKKTLAENELLQLKSVKQKNTARIVFSVLACLFAALGIAVFVFINNILALLAIELVAIAFLIVAIIKKPAKKDLSKQEAAVKNIQNQIDEDNKKISSIKDDYNSFVNEFAKDKSNLSASLLLSSINNDFSRYSNLQKSKSDYEKMITSLKIKPSDYEQKIISFELRYNQKADVKQISSILDMLRSKIAKLNELELKINEYDKNTKLLNSAKSELEKYLQMFNTDKTQSYENQIQDCRNKKRDYLQLEESKKTMEEEIAKFEKENNVLELKNISKPEKNIDELQKEIASVQKEIDCLKSENAQTQSSIKNYQDIIDLRPEVETDLELSNDELEKSKAKYLIIQKTMNFLTEAKESLEKKYMSPMKENFEKYISALDDKLSFNIDTDLNVSVENKGKPYESKYLSSGYKDLVNFCARMALVDSLYKTEQPAVILDDPFVNLDDDKITKALNLVKNISKEKQVVYFSCHKSRKIL